MAYQKENQVIENGVEVLNEFSQIYSDGIAVKEYDKLMKEYVRLSKRFQKTLKISTKFENLMNKQNETLNVQLLETIKKARRKIKSTVEVNTQIKQVMADYQSKIAQLENSNYELKQQNKKLKMKLLDS